MKLRETLFSIMGGIFIVFVSTVGILSNLQSKNANETWGKKLIQTNLELKKQQTLLPIIKEIHLVRQLAHEPAIIAMANNESDPRIRAAGLKVLEKYRLGFQDKSYFASFTKGLNFYYDDNNHSNKGKNPLHPLNPKEPQDQWFYATVSSGKPFEINVQTERVMKVTKVWINYVVHDHDRIVGVVGTGFNLNDLLATSTKRSSVKSFFIKKDLSIQLANDQNLIDYNSVFKDPNDHATIEKVITNPRDIEQIKETMETLEYSPKTIKTFWMMVNGEKNLVGMAYSPEIGLYEMTFFDDHDLVLLDNRNLFIILSLLFLIAIILVGVLVSQRIFSPMQRLKEHIVAFREKNEQGQLDKTMKGEIGNLINSIQTLLDQAYQQHATLAISKNHLEIILGQTDQAIAIIDPHQRLIVINTMWEARLGYSAHALRSKSLESIIPAREWSAQVHLLQTLVQPLHLLNHPYITKGGEITMIDVDFIPMESGEILMIASGMEMNAPRESSQMHPPTLVLNGTEGENTFTIQLTLEVEGGNKW